MFSALAFIVFYITLSLAAENLTVKYAAIIYRHGDRTPVDPYPTDPWRNQSWWPVKFGQLTNTGKRQHYLLGKWLRKRYSHLLSTQFDPAEVYVRSTDVDRTLMSAQANLAGMYPPSGNSVWDDEIMWQPIPVHTRPEKDDELLAMKRHCQAYHKEKEKYLHSKAYKERLSKYQGLMDYLTAYTGLKVKDYGEIVDVYSVLYIETLYNFTLPNWTHSVYPDKLKEPAGYSFETATGTPLMARLMAGPLMKQIVGNMRNKMKSPDSLNISIYSGHDFTIGNVLTALQLYDGICPSYTSTVFIELLYDESMDKHFVRISYRNTTEIVEPHVLAIPHCGQLCLVDRFVQLYENLITVDWEYECEKQITVFIGFSFLFGLALFAAMYAIHKIHFYRIYRRRNADLIQYTSVYSPAALPEKADY